LRELGFRGQPKARGKQRGADGDECTETDAAPPPSARARPVL
jgi:hypothetical protein